MKYRRKANLSTNNCSDISELGDNLRNCSECKKLLEMKKIARNREVAKMLPSNIWKPLILVKLFNFQRRKYCMIQEKTTSLNHLIRIDLNSVIFQKLREVFKFGIVVFSIHRFQLWLLWWKMIFHVS